MVTDETLISALSVADFGIISSRFFFFGVTSCCIAWELMTANRAAAHNMNTSMARSELAGMPAGLREGRFPMSELHKIFGIQVTRRKVDSLREFLKAMLEDEFSYQRWENDIQALLLDLDKIDKSF